MKVRDVIRNLGFVVVARRSQERDVNLELSDLNASQLKKLFPSIFETTEWDKGNKLVRAEYCVDHHKWDPGENVSHGDITWTVGLEFFDHKDDQLMHNLDVLKVSSKVLVQCSASAGVDAYLREDEDDDPNGELKLNSDEINEDAIIKITVPASLDALVRLLNAKRLVKKTIEAIHITDSYLVE